MAYQYGAQQPYGAPPMQQGYAGAPPPQGYGAQPMGAPPMGAPPMSAQPMGAPPMVNPEVMGWFQAVDTDRSGRITSLELQQALTNSNWSHFNAETCRLMIGMFDRDYSGTIDVNEFSALWTYIQQWKGVFDRFDGNRSGSIDPNEYHQALSQMGYRISPAFASLVVMRYDHVGTRQINLDSFIQACVLLKSVTDTFRQKDTAGAGSVRLSYEEFMTMCMLNKP